ncbi:unnamed protein product [Phytophthora lilii]|uniref:Unnamed protein product n=1 Tax=Phytophthora lilii TaxID=2077276 RepID=A0A9W6UAR7_9STRA|nr:unnamed protein product [Phytophthora lilii]
MSNLSKLVSPCRLLPFKANKSKWGLIELVIDKLGDKLQLIIRRDHCASGCEYKKIVGIYKHLNNLNRMRAHRSLQSVDELLQIRFDACKLVVQLYPVGFHNDALKMKKRSIPGWSICFVRWNVGMAAATATVLFVGKILSILNSVGCLSTWRRHASQACCKLELLLPKPAVATMTWSSLDIDRWASQDCGHSK